MKPSEVKSNEDILNLTKEEILSEIDLLKKVYVSNSFLNHLKKNYNLKLNSDHIFYVIYKTKDNFVHLVPKDHENVKLMGVNRNLTTPASFNKLFISFELFDLITNKLKILSNAGLYAKDIKENSLLININDLKIKKSDKMILNLELKQNLLMEYLDLLQIFQNTIFKFKEEKFEFMKIALDKYLLEKYKFSLNDCDSIKSKKMSSDLFYLKCKYEFNYNFEISLDSNGNILIFDNEAVGELVNSEQIESVKNYNEQLSFILEVK